MSQIRILFCGFILFSGLAISNFAHAQYAYMGAQMGMAGSGMWGGNQGCYAQSAQKVPEGVQDIDDEISELNEMKKEARDRERDARKEAQDLERKVRDTDGAITSVLKEELVGGVLELIRTRGVAGTQANKARICDGAVVKPAIAAAPGGIPESFKSQNKYCAQSGPTQTAFDAFSDLSRPSESAPGTMDPITCKDTRSVKPDYDLNRIGNSSPFKTRAIEMCAEGMKYLTVWNKDLEDKKAEEQRAKEEQTDIKKRIAQLRKDRRRAIREAKEDGEYVTEAGYCPTGNCGGPKLTTFDRVTNVAGSVLNAASIYFGAKHIANTNARLGWPTSPYAVTGLGLGSLMYGIYGAGQGPTGMCGGGGGPGGFYGPNGMGFGGGAFGYPGGWGPDGAGGAYNPGCGPWGCPGYPGGYPGGGYPIAGYYQGAMASAIGIAGAYVGNYAGGIPGGIPGAIGAIPGAIGAYPGAIGVINGGAMQATFNTLPYPMTGAYPGAIQGTFQGTYAPFSTPFQGGYAPYASNYSGYPAILAQQQAAAAAQAAAYQAQYNSALSLDARLQGQIQLINQQRASIWSSLGTANGGFGGFTGAFGTPTGTILPYPGGTGYDPNLGGTLYGTTTGTTTTGVTPARGRFGQ